MRSFLKYWLPIFVWLGVIFVGSSNLMSAEHTSRFLVPFLRWLKPDLSAETIAQIHFFTRKAAHLTEYAILAIFFWRALRNGSNLQMKMSTLFGSAWIACAVIAATDEFHQSFLESRTASPWDVMIDSGGAIFGLLISSAFAQYRFKKRQGTPTKS